MKRLYSWFGVIFKTLKPWCKPKNSSKWPADHRIENSPQRTSLQKGNMQKKIVQGQEKNKKLQISRERKPYLNTAASSPQNISLLLTACIGTDTISHFRIGIVVVFLLPSPGRWLFKPRAAGPWFSYLWPRWLALESMASPGDTRVRSLSPWWWLIGLRRGISS